jgi:hypothetical protein
MLHSVRILMLSVGMAALLATISSWFMAGEISGGRAGWVVALQVFGLKIALTFLPASLVATTLMPRIGDLIRESPGEEVQLPPMTLKLLLTALAVLALMQVPTIVSWWDEDRVLLRAVIGKRPDPMGFDMIPVVMLYSMPALAATAVATFVLTSILGIVARAQHTFRALGAATSLQAGLVSGEHLIVRGMQSMGEILARVAALAGDHIVAKQVTEWFARHEVVSRAASWPLVWLFAGYLVALVATEFLSPRRAPVATSEAGGPWPPEPSPAPPDRLSPQPVWPVSSAASVFDDSDYSVRPKWNWLDSIIGGYANYDIQTIPPMSRSRFSFTWSTGMLRREPDGPDLLSLQESKEQLLARSSYTVIEVVTAATLGRVKSNDDGWAILDAQDQPVAYVVETADSGGIRTFAAKVGDRDACRYTWLPGGLSIQSAELHVEFPPGSDRFFDRAFAMALAPLIEHEVRKGYRRYRLMHG